MRNFVWTFIVKNFKIGKTATNMDEGLNVIVVPDYKKRNIIEVDCDVHFASVKIRKTVFQARIVERKNGRNLQDYLRNNVQKHLEMHFNAINKSFP